MLTCGYFANIMAKIALLGFCLLTHTIFSRVFKINKGYIVYFIRDNKEQLVSNVFQQTQNSFTEKGTETNHMYNIHVRRFDERKK